MSTEAPNLSSTLELLDLRRWWFEQRLGLVRGGAKRPSGDPYTRTYDPYAAVLYQFPIVVDGPTTVRPLRPRRELWEPVPASSPH